MPRTRTIPDDRVFSAIHSLLLSGGEREVSFATVAAATGLAAPTLVQRYGSREGMVKAARLGFWSLRMAEVDRAIAGTADKGPQAFLKALTPVDAVGITVDLRDPDLAQRLAAWRATVEAALALRLGTGQKGRESAALLVAAWQGQALLAAAGDSAFKLKDAVKRLT